MDKGSIPCVIDTLCQSKRSQLFSELFISSKAPLLLQIIRLEVGSIYA